ncbi:MAG: pseudouridine synthase [Terrimesophilobacter sp.]
MESSNRSEAERVPAEHIPAEDGVRLQKLMAAAGVASRRVSENLIAAGRVEVNGEVVMELGRRVLETDLVSVDGVAIQLDTSRRYLMLNKPVGIVSSLNDDRGRPDLARFVSQFEERLFNVGRLDAQTSGLLILTNDGDLAHVLAHPSFGVMKTYIAKTEGRITPQIVAKLTAGVELEDGPIAADKARIVGQAGARETMIEITLHSGRNRIVRRMLEAVGHPVIDLVRRQFGPLHLGSLGMGEIRDLSKAELGELLTISREAAAETAGLAEAAGLTGATEPRETEHRS